MIVEKVGITENLQVKYKKGFRVVLDDGTVVTITKPDKGRYRVVGFYGTSYGDKYLDVFHSPYYASLSGCANYLLKNFGIELLHKE